MLAFQSQLRRMHKCVVPTSSLGLCALYHRKNFYLAQHITADLYEHIVGTLDNA